MTSENLIAGIDEVGRGALFGPVVAAAVAIAPADIDRLSALGVRDSKRLSARQRQNLSVGIREVVRDWSIGHATTAEIDRLNIFNATLLAMKRAVLKLKTPPSLCLVDGTHPIPELSIVQWTMVRGEEMSPAIAAASIIAKVWRDDLISRWACRYPEYGLAFHKGYGTEAHLRAIREYGPTRHHRRSFRGCS